MKKLLLISLFSSALIFASCSKKGCKECKDCQTKAAETLCEDDFEKTSDYNDKLEDMASDGCNCTTK